jgi:hypothetical protein
VNDRAVTTGTADVVVRLARLRAVLPLMARDLVAARRRATELEIDNQRLTRRVRYLESRLSTSGVTDSSPRYGDVGVQDGSAPQNGPEAHL